VRVFFSAGEASGDAYAAALHNEIAALCPSGSVSFEGIGGKLLTAAGARIVADSRDWGAIGITQSVRVSPRVISGALKAKKALATGAPGLFLPIDFGYVNVRLAKHAKRHGWKVLYFIPPGSWRRDQHGKDLPHVCDEIVSPFFWSAESLRRMGASAHCFGHPVKQLVKARERELHAAGQEDRVSIAVLPGSRRAELDLNLPLIAGALEGQSRTAEFAVASSFTANEIRDKWLKLRPERTGDVFTERDTYGVLLRGRAGIVCSGTATLEAALCVCPHVVVYQVTKLTLIQAKVAGVVGQHISQPNILLGREVVPELLLEKATTANIREHLDLLLQETEDRKKQVWAFMEIDTQLGPPDAITKTAELAAQVMGIAQPDPEPASTSM
jgi:lipid-A-disaccharide synthase